MNEKAIQKKVGNKIREIRIDKSMTQFDIAVICNYEKSTISRIEAGRTNITLKTLYALSKALNVPMKIIVDI